MRIRVEPTDRCDMAEAQQLFGDHHRLRLKSLAQDLMDIRALAKTTSDAALVMGSCRLKDTLWSMKGAELKRPFVSIGSEIELAIIAPVSEPEVEERRSRDGQIYFIEAGGFIKIGFSGNAANRLATLQTGVPFTLTTLHIMSGNLDQEQALHAKFSHLSERGEWFKADPELLAFIEELRARAPE